MGYTRNPSSGLQAWRRRRYCSKQCSNLAKRSLPVIERPCEHCGKILTKGDRESTTVFARRRFCAGRCAARRNSKPRYRKIFVGGIVMQEHRYVMQQTLGRELLPSESVHHKNGDRLDNRPDNLELWYKGQPAGQRVTDLIVYLCEFHRDAVLSNLLGGLE